MVVKIIQHHVQLFVRIDGNQLIQEIQKLTPAATTIMSGMDQPGRHPQSGKERGGAVARVFVSEAGRLLRRHLPRSYFILLRELATMREMFGTCQCVQSKPDQS